MPMVMVRFVAPEGPDDLRARIASTVGKLVADHLKKDPLVTAVLVEAADDKSWFVAGLNGDVSAYWIDVKVTAGTNLKHESTAFVKAVHKAMREILGAVHDECYVLVHAVDGHAYGFGGRTQEGRWAASNPG